MKNLIGAMALLVAGTFISSEAVAQDNFFSVGPELGFAMGDFGDVAGMGFGVTAQFEFGLSDNIALGANTGYQVFGGKDIDVLGTEVAGSSTYMMPIQVYARYYLAEQREGLYAGLKTGITFMGSAAVTTGDVEIESQSGANFGLAPEIGYFVTENISVSVRYQMLFDKTEVLTEDFTVEEENQTLSFVGVRAAWNF